MTDATAAPPPRLSAITALRHRDFARYATARFCATLAWQILGAAVGFQINHITHDPLALGLVGAAQFAPFLLCVLPAGQIADRFDRRLVLICAYSVEAVCAAALLWFTLSGMTVVWPVYVALMFFGAGRAFWMPAGQAMTPNLVPREAFPSAVAVNSTLFQAGVIIGPALTGVLLLWGPQAAYVVVVALLISVVTLMFTIRPVRATVRPQPFRIGDLLEGLRFVFRRRNVLGAISLDLFAVLFGGAAAMLPMYATDVLHVGPVGFGLLRAAPGVGAAVIAGVLAFSPIQRNVGRWMFSGVAVFGGATIVFGLSTVFWVSLIALVILGAGDMVSVFVRQLLVQLETPDEIRGRVSAVSSMFVGASNELGEFESGTLAWAIGLVPSVVLGGVATLLVVSVYLKLFPDLRRMKEFPRHH
jgi:MFS family permease